MRPRLGPDLFGNRALLLDDLLRLKPADWLAVKITDLVAGASVEHCPGPFDHLTDMADAKARTERATGTGQAQRYWRRLYYDDELLLSVPGMGRSPRR